MSKTAKPPVIYAYGFDKLRFNMPGSTEQEAAFAVKFVGYKSECSLVEADGLIIPSGIFEELDYQRNYSGQSTLRVSYDIDLLAEREKQVLNALKRGAWLAFLIQSVDNGEHFNWMETDLAKKFLNYFAETVTPHKPDPGVMCKSDEFREYLARFGIAQTSFWAKNSKVHTVLAQANGNPVGLEAEGQFFFLPFFTTHRNKGEIADAVRFVANAVLEYKRKNRISVPCWVNSLKFQAELQIRREISSAEEQLIKLREEAEKWERYKAILCTSGKNLNVITVEILRNFFGLDLKSEEHYVEDALIHSTNGQVKYVVEIKGLNGGIKREHINQVDSHRDRLNIGHEIQRLLIVNDFMDLEGMEARKAKRVDVNNLDHAQKHNVKVLRAVTLFEYMLALEGREDRQSAFFALVDDAKPLVEPPEQ